MRRASRARRGGWLIVLLLLGGAVPGASEAAVGGARLRIDGYVGPPHEGRSEQEDFILRVGSTDVRFQVTDALILSGGGLASKVFDRIRPYKPNFFLRGPDDLAKPLSQAGPGTKWRLTGIWIPGTRDFLLSSIEPREETKPAR